MEYQLNEVETRVLGSLIEKEMATPEYYPLSGNALLNACNQKTNRDPVVAYDEVTMTLAINSLKEKRLISRSDLGRVPKYEENFVKKYGLIHREAALISVLLLRGAQTIGELRSRTESLHPFGNIEEVEKTLEDLSERGLLIKLPRQPGHKEPRFAHLFAGEPPIADLPQAKPEVQSPVVAAENDRLANLEQEMVLLRQELDALKEAFALFRQQFE